MFEIGEYVWVEYDRTEAFIGQIMGLSEDEVDLRQVGEYKTHNAITDKLIRLSEAAVNAQSWENVRAQFMGLKGLAGLPTLLMGEKIVRTRLMYIIAEDAIVAGHGYLKTLDEPLRIILPRPGAVFKDARGAIAAITGATEDEPASEPVEQSEAVVDAEVEEFKRVLEEFEGLDADDPEGSVTGKPGEPENKPDF